MNPTTLSTVAQLSNNELLARVKHLAGREREVTSRHIPAEVRRVVWSRDGGRCAFVADNGRRCTEEGFLEFHHVVPHAAGGPSTAENIHLRCRAHNGHEAELNFGSRMPLAVREARASYMHVTGQRRSLSCLGISATRSGPSSNSDKSCLNVRRWVRLSDMVFLSARG